MLLCCWPMKLNLNAIATMLTVKLRVAADKSKCLLDNVKLAVGKSRWFIF